MRVSVGNDLPVHVGDSGFQDGGCPGFDVGVAGGGREGGSLVADVVFGVPVAGAPFFHQELFACVDGLGDVGFEGGGGEVGGAVGVDGEDVEVGTGEVRGLQRFGYPLATARADEDVGALG